MAAKEFELLFKLQASLGDKFKSAFQSAKTSTQGLDKNLQALKATSKNIEGFNKLSSQVSSSKTKLEQQKKVLEELNTKLKESGGNNEKLTEKIRRQDAAIAKTEERIRKENQSLSELREKLESAGVSTNNLGRENEELAKKIENVQAANEKLKKIGNLQDENRNKISSTKKELATTIGLITAAAGGTIAMMNKTASTTDRIDKLSQKIGISRKGFQEWDFILSQSGTDIEKMQAGMKTLVNRMGEAHAGAGAGSKAFQELGISVIDSNGKLKNQETVMEEVVSKMQHLPKGAEKSKLAFDLFGKAGLELMPLLNSAGGSVDDLKKKAKELGLVLSDEAIDAGVLYTDTMDQLKRSVGSLSSQIFAALMPAVIKGAKVLGEMTGKISNFAQKHPKLIELLGKVAAGLLATKVAALTLKLGFLSANGGILKIWESFTKFKALRAAGEATKLSAIFGSMAGKILPIVAAVTAVIVVMKLITGNADAIREKIRNVFGEGGVVIFDKFLNIITAVSEAVKSVFVGAGEGKMGSFLSKFSEGSPVIEAFKETFQTLMGVIPPIIETITSFTQAVLPVLIEVISAVISIIGQLTQAVLPVVLELINSLLPPIQQLVETILPILAEVINVVAQAFLQIVQAVLPVLIDMLNQLIPVIEVVANVFTTVLSIAIDSVRGYLEGCKQALSGLIEFLTGVFTGNWSKAWEGVVTMFGGIFKGLVSLAKAPLNAIISLINGVIRGLNKMKLPDWVPGIGGKGINIPEIPMLAKGSLSAPDTFIAGEKGPELITGSKGKRVFTANQSGNIFGKMKEAYQNAKETILPQSAPLTLAAAGAGHTKSVVINSAPVFYVNNGEIGDIEQRLRENNERLKREIRNELQEEQEDRWRREYS